MNEGKECPLAAPNDCVCPACNAAFGTIRDLLAHIAVQHFSRNGAARNEWLYPRCWCGTQLVGFEGGNGVAYHIKSYDHPSITPEDIRLHYLDAMMGVREVAP